MALENRTADRLDEDVEKGGELLAELGAVDAYVLEGGSARKLIEAREKAFWTLKAVGADDLIDTVVPRGAMPKFLSPRVDWRRPRAVPPRAAGTPATATCTWPSSARTPTRARS